MVYGKQVGVNHAAGEPLPADFVPVIADGELREGVPVRVLANGVKVLVVRRGAAIYAIREVCSHMGGPLAEGDLEGNKIRCPWHYSRFSVETGEVIDGPATHRQPCFETRVRDGRVEVRGREK
jgi:nitrite reductase/ring-hydroxylating ferredoxin subunit